MNTNRLKQIQKGLINPMLVKKKENLFYLTGRVFDHRMEEYLLITRKRVVGFGSGFEQLGWIKKTDQLKNIGTYVKPGGRLDIDFSFTYGEGEYLKSKLQGYKVKVQPAVSVVDSLRQVKEPGEIALIRKSMQIVERVFLQVKEVLAQKQWSEIGLAEFIESAGMSLGAVAVSFPPLVASGPNAAVLHHVPDNKKLSAGESVILDFGFKYRGYCSDFTRTVFLKFAPQKLAQAYRQVEKAYFESMRCLVGCLPGVTRKVSIRGVTAGTVYQKAVDVLAEKKLDKYFTHPLGHGTGLEIHELPNLSLGSRDAIVDGMVFSIEPGLYFPKFGGIRIEDLVYMEKGSVHAFIKIPTLLEENIIK